MDAPTPLLSPGFIPQLIGGGRPALKPLPGGRFQGKVYHPVL